MMETGEIPETVSPKGKSSLREWTETIVIALLIALAIRGFVVQVYLVEGESMEPTLHTAERLFVNKLIYRFRLPKPGEIIVLQDPTKPDRELIKRVIALPGETVEVKKGVVYVNNRALSEPFKNTLYTQYPDSDAKKVPEGHVFVMGDNRGQSLDSRIIGSVDMRFVRGEAIFMFWPLGNFGHGPLEQPRIYQQ